MSSLDPSRSTPRGSPDKPSTYNEHYQSDPSYNRFKQDWWDGGTFGLSLMDISQGPVDVIDPPIPEFAFFTATNFGGHGEYNLGNGWKRVDGSVSGTRFFDVQPARAECHVRMPSVDLRMVIISEGMFGGLLEEVGRRPSAIDGLVQSCKWLPEVARLLDIMWHASTTPGPATNLILDGAFMQLTGQLLAEAGRETVATPVAAAGDVRLARALDYLETHLSQAITVGELARAAAMSTSAFARSFRKATGRTVWEYVKHRRTERAHRMIVRTTVPLSQIAVDCGFSDAAHLSRTFRTVYGRAPSELR